MKRKKKGIKIAAALLTAALIVMLLCVVGCQGRDVAADPVETTGEPTSEATEAPTEHIHVYSEEIVDPSCTERGYTLFVCACGEDSYKDKFVDALGHDWSAWATVEEATEEKAGIEERKCARCGETETRDIPKVIPGHEHEYVESVAVPATCTQPGVMAYICECGGSFTNPIDPLGHDYSEKKVAPTCGEKGYTRHTCKRCGDSYDDTYTNPTGKHSWGKWTETKAPTCAKSGTEKRTCSVCNASETRNISATGKHSWGKWTETKAPTCAKSGNKERECTVCGSIESQSIPATGNHSWGSWKVVKAPTEKAEGSEERICSVCKASETRSIPKLEPKPTEPKPTEPKPTEPPVTEPPHKHAYKWVVTKAPTCTTKGVESYVCDCGDVKETRSIDATGHTWVENGRSAGTCKVKGHIDYICSNANCNATRSENTDYGDHNWVHRHTDEVGHEEYYLVCHCGGWSCKTTDSNWTSSWSAHKAAVKAETGTTAGHSYYESSIWVVDTDEVDYDECTICGATK